MSITIPTFNSAHTLGLTLNSIERQTYSNLETIIIDSFSKDDTLTIAEKHNAKVFQVKGNLLEARKLGVIKAKGEFVLLLDSDQILARKTIDNSVRLMKFYDALILEEYSYKPTSWIQKLFEIDRKLIHDLMMDNPISGVLLPRFFKKELLERIFLQIPVNKLSKVVAHDHAIIYFEMVRISNKIGLVKNAVYHIEPKSLIQLIKKNYRYGETTKRLLETGLYSELIRKKVRSRGIYINKLFSSLASNLLLFLKAVPYKIGLWLG